MERSTMTQIIKSNYGEIIYSGNAFACYAIPMNEGKFCEFRETIPFHTVWHTEKDGKQLFCVYYNQAK